MHVHMEVWTVHYAPMLELHPVLLLLIGFLAGAMIFWIRHLLILRGAIASATRRSVEQSRLTLKGKIAEQMAPLLEGFPYLPSDSRFLGDPIDYVVFHGYSDVKDGERSDLLEVVLLDIKHGSAKLSPSQRAVASAIAAGRVRFEVIRIAEDGDVTVQTSGARAR